MNHKIKISQLKKYDINQKIITALADSESRSILFSIIRKGKTATDLSESLKIPLSSVYKKLSDLEDLALILVEKYMISEKGRRFKTYRSRITKAEIIIKKLEPTLRLYGK
tara:strand:- start:209 stop:538 length:330 start_codon:yes stop_codon:yes gene_type:complete